MRAIFCEQLGGPEHLVLRDVPSPTPGPGEVKVALRARAVSFVDVLMIAGQYQVKRELPFIPGGEAAGVVSELGPDVDGVKPGDRVLVPGGLADETVVPAAKVTPLPDAVSFETGAAFRSNYCTAYYALQRGRLQPGEVLLVHGAAGGVGLAAVELGKVMGARVIACASSDEKLEFARQHGADTVINYGKEDLKDALRRVTANRGADVIYDPVGGPYTEPALRSIAWRGRLLVVGFAAGDIPKIPLNLTLLKGCSIVGVFWGDFARREPERFAESVRRLGDWYRQGQLAPHISATYPLEHAADALELMAARKVVGKVVLTVD